MLNYILRRLALMVPTLIGMTLMLFVLVRFAPGLTGGGQFGEGSLNSREDRARAEQSRLRQLHMLDADGRPIPLPIQYLQWLKNSISGDFGDSIQYHDPVSKLIRQRLPVTIVMNLIEAFVVYLIAIPMGMLAAVKRGKAIDVFWGMFTLVLYSLPVIWVGTMAIGIFANKQVLDWFPAGALHSTDTSHMTNLAYASDYLWHLVLPVTVMSLGGFAYLTKQMRASMLDNLNQEYARTARAKGLSGFKVVIKHVFRNSLLPMITIFAGVIPGLLGGSLIIEKIFSIPGMGQLGLTAALARDLPVLQALTFIGSIIGLLSLLLADLAYAIADPRVSYD
jgi:peptide/nickel transport system permease protein